MSASTRSAGTRPRHRHLPAVGARGPYLDIPVDDAARVRKVLGPLTRATWSGDLAILEMVDAGERGIDVTEWPSRYLTFLSRRMLREVGAQDGPVVEGRAFPVEIDTITWDTAAVGASGHARLPNAPALDSVAAGPEGLGVILGVGHDLRDPSFRKWLTRFARNAPARALAPGSNTAAPAEFRVQTVRTLFFPDRAALDRASREGWLAVSKPTLTEGAGAETPDYILSAAAIPTWADIV